MTNKLAIIAGGGHLPEMVVKACQQKGQPFVVMCFKGQPQPENVPPDHIVTLPLGALGKALDTLKSHAVDQVVIAGRMLKPSLFDLKPDAKGIKFLATLPNHHDDTLLSAICDLIAKEGYKVESVQNIFPELLAEQKSYGKIEPTDDDMADIVIANQAVEALGKLDIGQAAIVKNKVILGVEAVEGTDALIDRCATLRGKKRKGGVLVKRLKPGQDTRIDMPTIGPETVRKLAEHGYKGVAIQAGATLVLQPEELVKAANKAKIFVVGVL